MKKFLSVVAVVLFVAIGNVKAEVGPYFGLGVPYTSQYGLTFSSSPNFSFDIAYNSISISVDDASLELTKPELNLKYHVFGGATYFGLGLGYMNLEATASSGGQTVTAEVSSPTATPAIGWLWGRAGGGLIFGIEFGYQIPLGAEVEVSGPLTSGQEYDDAVKAAEDFGEATLPVITFAKIGYLF